MFKTHIVSGWCYQTVECLRLWWGWWVETGRWHTLSHGWLRLRAPTQGSAAPRPYSRNTRAEQHWLSRLGWLVVAWWSSCLCYGSSDCFTRTARWVNTPLALETLSTLPPQCEHTALCCVTLPQPTLHYNNTILI